MDRFGDETIQSFCPKPGLCHERGLSGFRIGAFPAAQPIHQNVAHVGLRSVAIEVD
jgi:hypothetical protein